MQQSNKRGPLPLYLLAALVMAEGKVPWPPKGDSAGVYGVEKGSIIVLAIA